MKGVNFCFRSVYGLFEGEVKNKYGIILYRFRAPRAAYEAASENPDNAGFCTPAGNCMGTGVLNISICQLCKNLVIQRMRAYFQKC